MPDIKMKPAIKHTIKTLDRSGIVAVKTKDVSMQTKDRMDQTTASESVSPSQYASNLMEQGERDGYIATKWGTEKSVSGYRYGKQLKGKFEIKRQERQIRKQNKEAVKKHLLKKSQKNIKTSGNTGKTMIKTAGSSGGTTSKVTQAGLQAVKKTTFIVKEATKRAISIGAKAVTAIAAAAKAIAAAMSALAEAIGVGGVVAVVLLVIVIVMGAALSIFGQGANQQYLPVSQEVQMYEPLIRLYAKEYDMLDYVDLIKAVMMQESGGRGKDPMQSSEGPFNARYPNVPNGIQDAEYSIACGVQELKSVLNAAEVESPVDLERIKLALQGYNYGNGYIDWAVEKDGGYTKANAIEFSDMMAERLGWTSYGDKDYVEHVLRYYPFTGMITGMGSADIVAVAQSQVGITGGGPYWSWYGFPNRVEWCACFVSWCAEQCGYINSGVVLKFSYCPTGANWFKSQQRWQDRSYLPAPGDIIFFDWHGDGVTDHVGIVKSCDGERVYTIEGNSGDMVKEKSYTVGNGLIYGYGVPGY